MDEFQKLVKDAFVIVVQAMFELFIKAMMPPYLSNSINQAHLEKGTYEHFVSYLEREIEFNGLEAPGELHLNTVTQQATKSNPMKTQVDMSPLEKPGHYRPQCR